MDPTGSSDGHILLRMPNPCPPATKVLRKQSGKFRLDIEKGKPKSCFFVCVCFCDVQKTSIYFFIGTLRFSFSPLLSSWLLCHPLTSPETPPHSFTSPPHALHGHFSIPRPIWWHRQTPEAGCMVLNLAWCKALWMQIGRIPKCTDLALHLPERLPRAEGAKGGTWCEFICSSKQSCSHSAWETCVPLNAPLCGFCVTVVRLFCRSEE